MRKHFLFFVGIFFAVVCLGDLGYAQSPASGGAKDKAKDKSSDSKTEKPPAVVAFWAKDLPKVTAKIEKRYDINRDEILQTSETKIFLRDVVEQVVTKTSFNVGESLLLKAYDKNKDGILSNIELDEIKKDLSY